MASRSELNGREKVSPSRILQAPSWIKTANLILLSTSFLATHIAFREPSREVLSKTGRSARSVAAVEAEQA